MKKLFGLNRYLVRLFTLLLLIVVAVCRVEAIELTNVRTLNGNRVELQGDFGKDCQRCEIIVDYAGKLRYAYRPLQWHQSKMTFSIKDFGISPSVKISVFTSTGETRSLLYRLKLKLKPPSFPTKPVTATRIDNKTVFSKKHGDKFGGKGVDQFSFQAPQLSCGKPSEVYHGASVVIKKRRFGDVRIDRQPKSACKRCQPLKVSWYHEPTGYIDYQLHIQRRVVEGSCQKNIRK